VVPLELRRADLGFGRVVVDDRGVTRRGLWSTRSIAWDEIIDYRLTIEMGSPRFEGRDLVESLNPLVPVSDVVKGYRGDHRFRFGIRIVGNAQVVAVNRRFLGVALAIAQIVRRIHPRLVHHARAAFERTGVGQFGRLALADHEIRWGDKPPLPRAEVESVELFNSSPVQLRVMARHKAWPYGKVALAEIPNIAAALELAEALGYQVRGRGLFAQLAIA